MGQSGSSQRKPSQRKRRTLFGRDLHKLENELRQDSDYVTLVRVIPSPNELTPNVSTPNIRVISNNVERRVVRRPMSTLPPRITLSPPKAVKPIEPNIYSDLKNYLRPKSEFGYQSQLPIGDDFEEECLAPEAPTGRPRPMSYSNHCHSRCLCNECRLTRYHLLNWLLPNCTRSNAERLLKGRPDGTFLVRRSEKFPNQYTLSFVCGAGIRHCLILRSVYGFGLKEPYKYPTLQQFVLHYAKFSLSEFNWKLNTTLKYPVFV